VHKDTKLLFYTTSGPENEPTCYSMDTGGFFLSSTAAMPSTWLPSSQPITNSTEQVHKSQLLTNLNINKIFPIPRHEVTNKNDDINNLLKIYHQNIWELKGKTNDII